jgi:5-methylcytosine-specific restriction endonuclease McrA
MKNKKITNKTLWNNYRKENKLNHKCEVCGKEGKTDRHHILPRHYYSGLLVCKNNIIEVCPRCHKFSSHSFHSNPVWASQWLKEHKPEQWEFIRNHI